MKSAAMARTLVLAFIAFHLVPAARAAQAAQVVIYPRQQEVEVGHPLPIVVEVINLAEKSPS